jgi:hypothetical protein
VRREYFLTPPPPPHCGHATILLSHGFFSLQIFAQPVKRTEDGTPYFVSRQKYLCLFFYVANFVWELTGTESWYSIYKSTSSLDLEEVKRV